MVCEIKPTNRMHKSKQLKEVLALIEKEHRWLNRGPILKFTGPYQIQRLMVQAYSKQLEATIEKVYKRVSRGIINGAIEIGPRRMGAGL